MQFTINNTRKELNKIYPGLYLISTPIGNLEDITLRAIRMLSEVHLIAAEDTRVTRRLLSRYDIHTPLTSYNDHNVDHKFFNSSMSGSVISVSVNVADSLEIGDLALVSDAGTPVINDPGYELIRSAIQHSIPVIPVPGVSSITTAIVLSEWEIGRFIYLGFLGRKRKERKELLIEYEPAQCTLICLESPHRLRDTLEDILHALGDRRLTVCREMTKLYEESFRGTVSTALSHFQNPKGEFTLLIHGNGAKTLPKVIEIDRAGKLIKELKEKDHRAKDIIRLVKSETDLSRREIYKLIIDQSPASES